MYVLLLFIIYLLILVLVDESLSTLTVSSFLPNDEVIPDSEEE